MIINDDCLPLSLVELRFVKHDKITRKINSAIFGSDDFTKKKKNSYEFQMSLFLTKIIFGMKAYKKKKNEERKQFVT